MSEEVSNWGVHRSFDPRHSPSVEANPNYHSNNELHAQDTDQVNAVKSVGACHHPDAGNPSVQGGSMPGGMELDDF